MNVVAAVIAFLLFSVSISYSQERSRYHVFIEDNQMLQEVNSGLYASRLAALESEVVENETPKNQVRYYLKVAQSHFNTGDITAVENYLNKLYQNFDEKLITPHKVELLRLQSDIARLRGDFSSVESHLRDLQTVEKKPDEKINLLIERSDNLVKMGRHEEALELLETKEYINEEKVSVHLKASIAIKKAQILYLNYQFIEALDIYDSIESNMPAGHQLPKSLMGKLLLGRVKCLYRIKDHSKAEVALRRLKSLNPDDFDSGIKAQIYTVSAQVSLSLEQYELALSSLQSLIETYASTGDLSSEYKARLKLAKVYHHLDRQPELERVVDELIMAYDGSDKFIERAWLYRAKSEIEKRRGDSKAAFQQLERYAKMMSLILEYQIEDIDRQFLQENNAALEQVLIENEQLSFGAVAVNKPGRLFDISIEKIILSAGVVSLLCLIIMAYRFNNLNRTFMQLKNADNFTGLESKPHFQLSAEKRANLIIQKYRRVSALLIKIDGLKVINESYDYHLGDKVLLHVARLIKRALPDGFTVSRLSNSTFVVLLPYTREMAFEFAEKIRTEVEYFPWHSFQASFRATVSATMHTWDDKDECLHYVYELQQELKASKNLVVNKAFYHSMAMDHGACDQPSH